MAARLQERVNLDGKLSVMPPWPHENHLEAIDQSTNPFTLRHHLTGKFVIMYSGNHSPSNPLDTLLAAALKLRDDDTLRFLFVGGGVGKKQVEAFIASHNLTNCLALPYQPLADLKYSLSAADVHVVSLGSDMVGIIHPCKIYGAMSAGRAILFFGPRPSHVTDLLDRHPIGWHIAHGDVTGALTAIKTVRALPPTELRAMGAEAQRVLHDNLSQAYLCGKFCDELESGLQLTEARLQSSRGQLRFDQPRENSTHAYDAGHHVPVSGAGV
jgi:glycosyltransferase involved in cell wall biosynthesis